MDNNQNKGERNVIGLVGFILSFFMGLPALICSIIGIVKAKKLNGDRMGLSIAGTILSGLKMLITSLIASFFIGLVGTLSDVINDEDIGNNRFSTKILCTIAAEDCVSNENGAYTCKIDVNDEERTIICDEETISNYQLKEYDDFD